MNSNSGNRPPEPCEGKLDLLLVNPSSRTQVYQALGDTLTAVEPPIWAGFMATFMRNRGFAVKILDAEAFGLSAEQTAAEMKASDALLTVMVVYGHQPSASTQNMTAAGAACAEFKKIASEKPLLMVGGHVSALPERTLTEEDVDFVCQGEGPYTILKLLELIRARRLENLEAVPGLWYWNGEEIRSTAAAPLIENLDRDLPTVAWDLLPMERYRAHNWHCFDHIHHRQPYAAIYTSLGCPYKCTFCCINAPFGKSSIRYRSPESVIAEITTLVEKYGVKNIKIEDEMFVLSVPHVEGICDQIIQRGYRLNIWAYARVDTVKEGLLPKMKRAGFNWLALGIESGSKHVRDGAHKRFTQDDIRDTVRAIQAADIRVIGNYIFGLPDDDLSTMRETLALALDLNCEFANFYSAMAYPGSPLYAMALKEGWKLPAQWHGFSQHSVDTLPLPTKHISAAEVLRFRDQAFHAYFSHPPYLAYAESKFGADTAAHIREMSRHHLIRTFA